ncbi:MAG: DUF4912 domain-containing protein [Spirochaetales bacterium]|nr:DUF4912 domain-containing protein [Spirochaetales bacterium]
MTKERLELLSDEVLHNLAKKVGLKSKAEWSRITLINSIIDAMEEERSETESLLNLAISMESKKYSVTIDEELDFSYDVDEEMEFPHRYNENMLHFMLRDNSWGFVLLDIKNSFYQQYQNDFGDIELILRVIELEDSIYKKDDIIDYFDIQIEKVEKARYINLPNEESFYCVELILRTSNRDVLVNRSQVLATSRNHVNYIMGDNDKLKTIVKLSGFSNVEDSYVAQKNYNRILPIDSMEEES